MSWQDQYEAAADRERQAYQNEPLNSLLTAVDRGNYGQYNMIWPVIAEQATLQQAAGSLFRVLERTEVDYLIRCNCAETLLELLNPDDDDILQRLQDAVDLTSGTPAECVPHLAALKQKLRERLGPSTGI